jgi:sec-independent protein translocase protein TatB
MFDLSWGEMARIGVVALVVLGPKELPNALRTITNLTKTARKLANEFQSGVNEIVREADLEDARKLAQGVSKGSISKAIEKAVDPTGDLKTTIKGVESEARGTEVRGTEIKGTSTFPVIPNPTPQPTVERTQPAVEGPTVQRETESATAAALGAEPPAPAPSEAEVKS